jgi:hypothetical protein
MESVTYPTETEWRNCAVDDRDLVIADLADENAALRDVTDQLVDLLAEVTFENIQLRVLYDREFLARYHGDIVIARLERQGRGTDDDSPEPSHP